jgi:hypothetical protein
VIVVGRHILSRVLWTLPVFVLLIVVCRWPAAAIPSIVFANFLGYCEPRPSQ